MNTNKVLAGLSYLSVFCVAFIFPLIVFLVSSSTYVKEHAKKALISHIIPIIPVLVLVSSVVYLELTNQLTDTTSIFLIAGAIFTVVVSIIVSIWNLVKAIKVFANDDY